MAAGIKSRGGLTIPGLRSRIAGLSGPAFRAKLSQVLSAAAFKMTMDTFHRSTDPYGRAWARLKVRKGKPLLDTGRMRASTYFVPLASGFRVDFSANYAVHHQYGTRRMVRRQMIPMPETGGLPPTWSERFDKETEALITRELKRAA